ncbi:MAG: DNA-binding response regulator [Flammeovirgaceae bacterium]|nr:DNA-binding response regulator [Flammeovirgaceae bacterium]MBE61370.1 DNA-binding response regulator [Flammeovirgaceae bacterium]HCX22723.1 DNA-binding response regulator [Cytophagales bacterium]
MPMLKCVIIDDEQPARMLITEYVKKVPFLELVGEFKSPIEAMSQFPNLQIDLIFLDIQMPGLTGLEFARTLNNKPHIILTTAYSEYALESYELDVDDYLMKPISFERFFKAVSKIVQKPSATSSSEPAASDTSLIVKADGQTHRIYTKDILYIEGLKEYVTIHTNEKKIITLESLKKLTEELPANEFLRVHKSFIINLTKVSSHSNHDLSIGAKKIPIGSSYRDEVLKMLF